jgi:peptidoglycan/LPS O-acetylase OafA/YrhL
MPSAFFAIMGVILTHNWKPAPAPWIFGGVQWGELGVRLFFSLSGFLITGFQIRSREVAERGPERRLFFMRQFYIRRFVRIFPIYYLALVGLVCASVGPSRRIWAWLFTYTTNIYLWHHLDWIGDIGHLWTLAVEEQFYLVWPWLLLFLPRKWLVPLLLGLICLAPSIACTLRSTTAPTEVDPILLTPDACEPRLVERSRGDEDGIGVSAGVSGGGAAPAGGEWAFGAGGGARSGCVAAIAS